MRISFLMKRLKKRNREDNATPTSEDGDMEGGKRHIHDDLEDMVQTPFPDLAADEVSTEVSDVDSDDEEAIAERQQKYNTKVDQDVAVFLKLTEQMSLESLLHLMEGQARTQNLDYIQKYKRGGGGDGSGGYETDSDSDSDSDSDDDSDDEDDDEDEDDDIDVKQLKSILKSSSKQKTEEELQESAPPALSSPKPKHFRFAEITGNKVREVIHEIDPLKSYGGDLWWQESEIREIRKAAIETVRFYVRHRKDFKASVEQVYCAETQQNENPKDVKKLADESFVRGLEGHIVPVFASRRNDFRGAMLELQQDFDNKDYDRVSAALSECSVSCSQLTTKFALRMAQIDYLEALKSNMSRWRPENDQKDTDGFFDC